MVFRSGWSIATALIKGMIIAVHHIIMYIRGMKLLHVGSLTKADHIILIKIIVMMEEGDHGCLCS